LGVDIMADEECVFCKIIKGDIPSSKVYEDEDFIAFLDIAPANKGHTLVIPKEHSPTLLETPDEVLQKMIPVVKKVGEAVKKGVQADGVSFLVRNGKAADQVVFHLHCNIVPRFEEDGLQDWHGGKYDDGEVDFVMKKIKENL